MAWFRVWLIAGADYFLAVAVLVLEPEFDRLAPGKWERWAVSVAAFFLNASIMRMSWAGTPADRALLIVGAKTLADDLRQIDPPSAHHAIDSRS